MARLSEKKMLLLTTIVVALLVLAGLGGIYTLKFKKIKPVEAEIADLTKKIDEARNKQAQIDELKATVEALNERKMEISGEIPVMDDNDLDLFFNSLDEIGVASGVIVSSTKAKLSAKRRSAGRAFPPNVQQIQFKMKAVGPFINVLKYLNGLESYSRHINVESFSIRKKSRGSSDTGDSVPMFGLDITIYTYALKSGQKKKKPAPKEPEDQRGVTTPLPAKR